MRIPLARRIGLKHAAVFALVLVVLQQVQGTGLLFSALCGAYVLISAIAFNAAGGLQYPSGFFIFFTATTTALVGLVMKVVLGEAGDSNLRAPVVTMAAYCVGVACMGAVALLLRHVTRAKGLLPHLEAGESMWRAAQGAVVLGVVIQAFSLGGNAEDGSLGSAVRQINYLIPVAILLATFYQVKKTGGRRSTNWVVWAAGLWSLVLGIASFSKQGILTAPVMWFGAAVGAGQDFSRKQILGVLLGAAFFQAYLIPFSQYGRVFKSETATFSQDAVTAADLLLNLRQTRAIYEEAAKDPLRDPGDVPHYFDQTQGIFDRMCMLAPDDALIAYTEQGNVAGYDPTFEGLMNVVPHFIWKNKPFYYVGNGYGREIGIISEDNETTGISFSPVADAFHQDRWFGVTLMLPAIILLLFLIVDGLAGEIRSSPWGLFFALTFSHTAPEGMIGGQIYTASYTALGITIVALLARYVLPLASSAPGDAGEIRVDGGPDGYRTLRSREMVAAAVAPEAPG